MKDREAAHSKADRAIIAFLRAYGFKDIAAAWEAGDKWYA